MTPPISPTGGCPDPAGRGARLATVVDTTPTVGLSACLAWVHDDRRLCALRRGHNGAHLPLALPWPREDVSATNPRYRKEQNA
jgi:hypothetical protein